MSKWYPIGIIAFIFVGWNALAAPVGIPDQYKFSLIDINNGLSHSRVNCFLKDSRGYVWIGTGAGLNRYNGYQVKVFRYDSRDSLSINANDITKLFEDPDGKIWVGTSRGFNVYDPETEKFYRDHAAFLKGYDLPNTDVEDIIKDREGNFWFVLTGYGLSRYDTLTKTSVNLRHTAANKNSISTNHISAIAQNSEGDFWLVHRNGMLEKLHGKTLEVIERNSGIYRQFDKELLYYGMTIDSDDDLWLYLPFDSRGVFYYDHAGSSLTHIHKDAPVLKLNNNLVKGIVENQQGEIWIGTDHGGINVIDKKDFSVHHILHNPEIENSLSHNSIYSLYKDNNGIIWVGTHKNGVNYYHENIIRFQHYKHQIAVSSSLPYDDINSFAEDHHGNIWIGTNGKGLVYFNRSTGNYTHYQHTPGDPHSLSSDIIVSLLVDQHNTLWIGTYFGGLNSFDGKKFTRYRPDSKNPGSIGDDSVWELMEDSQGNLWVGTHGGGLDLYDAAEGKFYHHRAGIGDETIHSNYIAEITEDRHGRIWLGGGHGVDVINRETGKVIHFLSEPGKPQSLPSNQIHAILRDSYDQIWVGSQEGLSLYQEDTHNFVHFTTADGLPHNAIMAILEASPDNLWLSTPNGISHMKINRQDTGKITASFHNYDKCDGLQGKVFNESAALKTRNGEMIFGGPKGFNIFHPDQLQVNENVPKIVFTDVQLFNKSLEVGKERNGRVILSKALSETKHITLEHDENIVSIEFAALSYLHPEKNKYKYKLEGFDKEWHTADKNSRRVTYTNLDPGNYEFRVLAANNDGIWNEEGISLQMSVLAPFWRTNTAYGLYMILFLGLLYTGRSIMLQRARTRFKIEQERREARQLRELDLMKIRFFTNLSHEFRTPLALILAPLERLLANTENIVQQNQLLMIQRNGKRLLNLVNQLLDFRKIEVEGVKLHPSEGNIIKFVEASVSSFSELSEKKNITLSYQSTLKELQASFDMDKLEKILFNLLSNAFKFTPENGKIIVEVDCFDNDSYSENLKILQIKVRDTGIGIPKDKQEKVFDRFFRDDVPSSMVNQGSGIGLCITREFVKIHGGTISLESEPGAGSCFTVTILIKEISGFPGLAEDNEISVEKEPATVASLPEPSPTEAEPESLAVEKAGEEELPARKVPVLPNETLPTLLLVEDNEDFRSYLRESLGNYYNIIEAINGKEGWQKALSAIPDLIVSDLMMPEMNGMELCKKIKGDSRTSHIPLVMLTAHTAEENMLKGLATGANDYVTKPFNFDMLLSRIRNLITQRKMLQKAFEKKISVQTSEADIVSLDDKLVQKAIKIVEDNLSDPDFSVEVLSRELGMSRTHLYKKMLSLTGKSPLEFIRKIRLQRAAQFLEKSQLTVAEVAYKVGFNNTKYFTKYFKNEFNILPSLYAERKEK
jgi:signal transduction histidine kinase/ligand-binding sensor domain-containing protein/DNA-binding response OmpR family regulator